LKLALPKVYPITDARISGLSHVRQVKQMIAAGASFIQLREKHVGPSDFYVAAAEVIEIARPQGLRIIINDRVDIALALSADGVHLGQDDMPPGTARDVLGNDAIIGFSTHSIAQVEAAADLPIDYLAFGPVFSTQSKENADAVVGLELLRQARLITGDIPLVAIGGITAVNVRSVIDAGADSAAVIGAIVSEPDEIEARTRELLIRTSR